MKFAMGQTVKFAGVNSLVTSARDDNGQTMYLVESGAQHLPMEVTEDILERHQNGGGTTTMFHIQPPDLIVVDDFYRNPDEIREIALAQQYHTDLRFFKGERSNLRFLWPYLREEFSRLLGRPVTEWLGHNANGVFQKTQLDDPLVWHSDSQQFAGAVYLTPDAPPNIGTSFWRDKRFGVRHHPTHQDEQKRFGSNAEIEEATAHVQSEYNLEHGDNWELIESVAGLYNRLVIWDARLIHSATTYDFGNGNPGMTRLVQLFFFDADA